MALAGGWVHLPGATLHLKAHAQAQHAALQAEPTAAYRTETSLAPGTTSGTTGQCTESWLRTPPLEQFFLSPHSRRRRHVRESKVQAEAPPSDRRMRVEAEAEGSLPLSSPLVKVPDEILEPPADGHDGATGASTAQRSAGRRAQKASTNAITLDDLMVMIKDAEKNILVLNRVRTRALEDLDAARHQNQILQGQLKVLQARLAEADAKLILAVQTKAKNEMLQDQIQEVQEKFENVQRRSAQVDELQLEVAGLQDKLVEAESQEKRVLDLQAANRSLEEQMTFLEKRLMEREEEVAKDLEELESEKYTLRSQMADLEEKLEETEGQMKVLEQAAAEKDALEKEVKGLRDSARQIEVLQKQLVELQANVSQAAPTSRETEEKIMTEQAQDPELSLEGSKDDEGQQVALLKLEIEKRMKENEELREKLEVAADIELQLNKVKAEKATLEKRIEKLKLDLGSTERKNTPLRKMQTQLVTLQKQLAMTVKKAALVEQVEAERDSLQKTVLQLQADLEQERRLANDIRDEAETEGEWLREHTEKLQERLGHSEERTRQLEGSLKQLEELGAKGQLLEAEVEMLKTLVKQSRPLKGAAQDTEKQNRYLKEQVQLMQAQLAEMEAERSTWLSNDLEKASLQEQVQLLKERLIQSDEDMQTAVEFYRTELEGFQQRLEQLDVEISANGIQLPVGAMPWEFWSDLLLVVDDLMLSGQLTKDEGMELRSMAWRRDSRISEAFVSVPTEHEAELAKVLRNLLRGKTRPGMHIIHIAAEMAPVAKVGGLADVVTGLGKALQSKGHLVEVVLPKYDCMDYSRIKGLKAMNYELNSYFDGQMFKSIVWRGTVEGLPVYFIEPLHPSRFFWRGTFYGEGDDFQRFTFFCRAALEFLMQAGKRPDIIHSHDWQTAVVAPLYWDIYYPQGFTSAKVAFTCHNFEYQGSDSPRALASCGLDVQSHFRQDRMQDNFMPDRVNLLKGGFVYSNLITTVSPTYAVEVRGPEGGRGLQVTLAAFEKKFFGVLNGIDYEAWDPAADPLLDHRYSADELEGKLANKAALRKRLGLSPCTDIDKPLVGCITRLVPQKGVHLIRHAIYRTCDMGGQFVLLGSSPVPEIQRDFENLARQFEHHQDVRLLLKYDEALSHSIFAGSDLFVIPSIFEPCGLTQLIAMRYGSIPVVRKTGGLADSVFDVDDANIPEQRKNGFTFTATDEKGLNYALDRALNYYFDKPEWWWNLVRQTMKMDFSWGESSQRYVELYEKALSAKDV